MAARLAMLAPRLIALVVIWLLAAASWTLAAGGPQAPTAAPAAEDAGKPEVLVVPDVRRQAYVFAKGILQDAGFAWRVRGDVGGYAANTVVSQVPAPGVRVVDNGAPTVALRLQRSAEYDERGVPENESPYDGTSVVLLRDWQAAQKESAPAETQTEPAATTTTAAPPAPTQPAEPAEPAEPAYREPDFVVAGAPREPAGELPLPKRAVALKESVAALGRKPGRRFVDRWLYQHSWIVTGARFGWKDGDDALRTLIQIDRSLQVRFGFGARSERVARRALAYVEARKSS
ncbi:MAG TPA: PASTA domain-containing protein [Gaiellaceae bacterium]|nr:PASTA domain-containing protein [Gaiellaceae bacterium]HXV96295.1 PASTA domain-containing protein [Gaiellaceae bacterium]